MPHSPASRSLRPSPAHPPRARPVALAVTALLAVVPAAGHAAADPIALSLEQLLDVKVVGASKYEQSRADVAAAVRVIGRDEIRAYGWRTLDQALASLPGVHTTYDRQYVYLGTRGFGLPGDYNTRVLVTVNGNRLNDVTYDGGPMGRQLPIDLDAIERIEFIPGPGSAVYGQNAMFGVVNLVTRSGESVAGTELRAGGQQPQSLVEGTVVWGRRLDSGWDVLVTATGLRAGGQDLSIDYGAAGVSGTARGQDRERDVEAYARAARGPWAAELVYGRWRKDDPTGAFLSDPLTPGQYQGDGYAIAQLQWQQGLRDDSLQVLARAFAGREDYRSRLFYDGAPFEFPATSVWLGGEVRLLSLAWPGHKLMVGLEAQDNRRADQSVDDVGAPENSFTIRSPGWRVGVYVQDEWRFAEGWSSTLGARVDRNDRTGTAVSPRAALIWQPSPATTLKAMAGRAHRAPNAYEQDYDDGFAQIANPALDGETIDTFELVGEHRLGDGLLLGAAAYAWKMKDLITLGADADSGITQYRSGAPVHARGVELTLDKVWTSGARLRAGVALQRVRGDDGAELVNSPQRQAKLNLAAPLPWAGVRAGVEWQYESSRLTLDGSRLGGRSLANLFVAAAGWQPGLEVALTVGNLSGKRYAHPGAESNWQNAIPQDGRSVRLDLRWRF